MSTKSLKKEKRERRHKRIRSIVFGTSEKPRLSVYRSNKGIYGQIIDDENGTTLASVVASKEAKKKKSERAYEAGKKLAEDAKGKKIKEVIFDRGGFIYIGNVKAFAEGAREGGLVF
jgi:large subunit ribosomal protein L18